MENREATEQAAGEFIARRDIGPWTEADAGALDHWLAQSPSHRVAYYRLNAAWTEAGRARALGAGRTDPEVSGDVVSDDVPEECTCSTIVRPVANQRRVGWLVAAACFLVAVVGSSAWHWLADQSNIYSTPIGATEVVPLADGSRITLNTNSRARVFLGQHERRVELMRGEIFVEVTHDPVRPFFVQAGARRVVAVGTQFSVRFDQDDLRVIVTEGTVKLESEGTPGIKGFESLDPSSPNPTELMLPAGTVARAGHDAVLVQERPLSEVTQSLSWRAGLLTFRGTRLADAVAEFNRYNSRKIVIDDPRIASSLVGGIFRATNVEPFVHLLEEGFPIQVTTTGDQIILTSRP